MSNSQKRTSSVAFRDSLSVVDVNRTWMIPDSDCWVQVAAEEPSTEIMYSKCKIKDRVLPNQTIVQLKDLEESYQRDFQTVDIHAVHQVNRVLQSGYADMVQMDHLNEPEILMNLLQRYKQDSIFTFIGPTLIVMNPYKKIPQLLSPKVLEDYAQQANKGSIDYRQVTPHTYALAAQAYCKLFQQDRNQAIVISGESGAGKTENAKISMQFLTSLSSGSNTGNGKSKAVAQGGIEDRILGCNPILEAFGNAKTVRNDNSSRFGKFVQICVNRHNRKIEGARIISYLLEKSRVTTQGAGERNYHIFYHLLFSKNQKLLQALYLDNRTAETLNYLKQSGCSQVASIDDSILFQEVQEAFHTMRVSAEEENTIYRIIAAILLLGNVEFDAASLTDSNPCSIIDPSLFKKVAQLLQVNESNLAQSIHSVTRKIGSSVILSPKKLDETISSRDSVARNLYDRLFSWIVQRLNSAINNSEQSSGAGNFQLRSNSSDDTSNQVDFGIGLLDIFGFEVFQENSFEQFCINYTNEKLQQLYIQYVFKSEEQEFLNEGLAQYVNQLGYKDNQLIIDVLDKSPFGVFHLIDESSSLASSSDAKLFDAIQKQHKASSAQILFPQRLGKKIFTIIHSAKSVDYCVDNFREKNKAEVSLDLSLTLARSKDPLVSCIFLCLDSASGETEDQKVEIATSAQAKNTKENKFLGCKFRAQMKQLMNQLISADCHFIRCIKPNEQKRPNFFLQGYVLIQIKYLGVLQAILARKEGYPYRKDFKVLYNQFSEMVERYRSIKLEQIESERKDLKEICNQIISQLFDKKVTQQLLFGKTKIFAKDDCGKVLDDELYRWYEKKKGFAKKIIKSIRKYLFRKKIFANLHKIISSLKVFIRIQAICRMKKQRTKYLNKRKATQELFSIIKQKQTAVALAFWQLQAKKETEALKLRQAKVNQLKNEENGSMTNSTVLYQTLERHDGSSNYSSTDISNYNTFNLANNQNNLSEVREGMAAAALNNDSEYVSMNQEAEKQAKLKAEFQEIQEKNREIIQDDLEQKTEQKIKTTSKLEYFLNLNNQTSSTAPPLVDSEDRFLDFTASNQVIIDKIKQNVYQQACMNIFADRKKTMSVFYTLTERMSFQKIPLSKPLTPLAKHHEPAAVKAFLYMLKYAGDKRHDEPHPRVLAWKLLKLIMNQDEQEVTDEIFLQVIKQLTNNLGDNIEKYFQLAGLIASTITISTKIAFSTMNFFYEQAVQYAQKKLPRLEQWCKYILLRIGNNLVYNGMNDWDCLVFKRKEIPLKEEFSAIEKMKSLWQPVNIYNQQMKYFKVESYTKICNLIGMIGLDMEVMEENNWYGIVEYLTIDGVTRTEILDFGTRVLDWRAYRHRQKQEHMRFNPSSKYTYGLYYQTVIVNTLHNSTIDTTLMLYATYSNEYLHGIYFIDQPLNTTSLINCLVELAASKSLADFSVVDKQNLTLINYLPSDKIPLLNPEVWRVKIQDQIKVFQKSCNTQRKARSLFLSLMKKLQGKYFLTQKFYCDFGQMQLNNQNADTQQQLSDSDLLNLRPECPVVALSKLGFVYFLSTSNGSELAVISLRDIVQFSLNFFSETLYIHTISMVYCIKAPNAVNLYYNIDFYIKQISDIEEINGKKQLEQQLDSNKTISEDEEKDDDDDDILPGDTPPLKNQNNSAIQDDSSSTPKKLSLKYDLDTTDSKLISVLNSQDNNSSNSKINPKNNKQDSNIIKNGNKNTITNSNKNQINLQMTKVNLQKKFNENKNNNNREQELPNTDRSGNLLENLL